MLSNQSSKSISSGSSNLEKKNQNVQITKPLHSADSSSDIQHQQPLITSALLNRLENDAQMTPFQAIAMYKKAFVISVFISFGGFMFGWDTGTIGGITNLSNFKEKFGSSKTSDGETTYFFRSIIVGLLISCFNLGCAFGGLTLGKLGDIYGRKIAIYVSMFIYIIGIVIQISSTSSGKWYQYLIGRVVGGLAVGATSVLVPMFIGESAPSVIRGSCVALYQLMCTMGILMGYITMYGTKTHYPNDHRSWIVPLSVGICVSMLVCVGTWVAPESARFLIKKDRIQEAAQSLASLSGNDIDSVENQNEVENLIALNELESSQTSRWLDVFKACNLKRVTISSFIMAFQQTTGINYFFYYGTSLFTSVGIEDSYITSIILGAVNFVITFLSIPLVEKLGRKSCLLWGAGSMFICMLIYASCGSFAFKNDDGSNNASAGKAMIVFTCFYICGFGITWGPCAFVINSEMFGTSPIKSQGMAIATAVNWIFNFVISLVTPFITKSIGFKYGYVFAVCLALSFFFVLFFTTETKGLSLEEIDAMFDPKIEKEIVSISHPNHSDNS